MEKIVDFKNYSKGYFAAAASVLRGSNLSYDEVRFEINAIQHAQVRLFVKNLMDLAYFNCPELFRASESASDL